MVRKLAILAAALAIAVPGTAGAQSVPSLLKEFGLVGTWAADCSQPPSGGNLYTSYTVPRSGNARMVTFNGRGQSVSTYVIHGAKKLPEDQLAIQEEWLYDHTRIEVVVARDKDRIRIWSSRRADGTYLIRDGRFLPREGMPPLPDPSTPWLARCKSGGPAA